MQRLIKNDCGFAATETAIVVALFLIVFIAVLEVSMLCVRGELMLYATTRGARVAEVYRNELGSLAAGAILPTTAINDASYGNVEARLISTSYEPLSLTRMNVFYEPAMLENHMRVVPALPEDISEEELQGDNPLPYCKLSLTEITPCDPM